MTENPTPYAEARQRLNTVLARGAPLERQGFPLGSLALRNQFEEEVRSGSSAGAEGVVTRASERVDLAERRWGEVERLLDDVEALRDLATTAGMDLARVDARAGNPRELLLSRGPSEASLDAVARSAGVALATLREALPRYCVAQARALGTWARDARGRGEDVDEAVAAVGRVVRALHDLDLRTAVAAIAEARRIVVRTVRSSPAPSLPISEEEAILREAHNLARRLPVAEPGAVADEPASRGGPGHFLSATVMLTPEEEVAALWAEVDRLAHERELASSAGLYAPASSTFATPALPLGASLGEPPPLPELSAEPEDITPSVETAETIPANAPAPEPEVLTPSVPEPSSAEPSERAPEAVPETEGPASEPTEGGASAPPARAMPVRGSNRISFAAAYVPPGGTAGGSHRASRPARGRGRRGRSRHQP